MRDRNGTGLECKGALDYRHPHLHPKGENKGTGDLGSVFLTGPQMVLLAKASSVSQDAI